jgi:hypothetical protein
VSTHRLGRNGSSCTCSRLPTWFTISLNAASWLNETVHAKCRLASRTCAQSQPVGAAAVRPRVADGTEGAPAGAQPPATAAGVTLLAGVARAPGGSIQRPHRATRWARGPAAAPRRARSDRQQPTVSRAPRPRSRLPLTRLSGCRRLRLPVSVHPSTHPSIRRPSCPSLPSALSVGSIGLSIRVFVCVRPSVIRPMETAIHLSARWPAILSCHLSVCLSVCTCAAPVPGSCRPA